jgi:hypothetical protein
MAGRGWKVFVKSQLPICMQPLILITHSRPKAHPLHPFRQDAFHLQHSPQGIKGVFSRASVGVPHPRPLAPPRPRVLAPPLFLGDDGAHPPPPLPASAPRS